MKEVMLEKYFAGLVNSFYKILPMSENKEASLDIYMHSFQAELLGCKNVVEATDNDPYYVTLVSILQYLIDTPEAPHSEIKREVFRAISICKKLSSKYADCEVRQ